MALLICISLFTYSFSMFLLLQCSGFQRFVKPKPANNLNKTTQPNKNIKDLEKGNKPQKDVPIISKDNIVSDTGGPPRNQRLNQKPKFNPVQMAPIEEIPSDEITLQTVTTLTNRDSLRHRQAGIPKMYVKDGKVVSMNRDDTVDFEDTIGPDDNIGSFIAGVERDLRNKAMTGQNKQLAQEVEHMDPIMSNTKGKSNPPSQTNTDKSTKNFALLSSNSKSQLIITS